MSNYTSMGRDPNWQKTCCAPRCMFLAKGQQNGGWCEHPRNRVVTPAWPQGFTPSVASTGGCDLHSTKEADHE